MVQVNQVWTEQLTESKLVAIAAKFDSQNPSMFGVSMFRVGPVEVVYVAATAETYFVRSGKLVTVSAVSEAAAIRATK